ncbi:ABC transporter permease [bacterium]|nr:ABC transporter permease [bacterium]
MSSLLLCLKQSRSFQRFLQHRFAVISVFVIAFFAILALGAPLWLELLGLDSRAQDVMSRYAGSSSEHLLGTDELGRDILARLISGSRISLGVAIFTAIASVIIGFVIGSLAGFFGGWIDSLLMRATDALLMLPLLPVLIVLSSLDFEKIPFVNHFIGGESSSIVKMIMIFVLFSWMQQARIVRGAVLQVKELEFVQAARALGRGNFGILTREIAPHTLSPLMVSATLSVGQSILFEAALSFLGLGVQPPNASWGNMLNNGLEALSVAPQLVILPGLMILFIVMSFNFLGDGLSEALDPKSSKGA